MPEVKTVNNTPAFTRRDLLRRWWSQQKAATTTAAAVASTAAGATAALGQAVGFGMREAAHLLRRAGFGGTTEEIQNLISRGRAGAVDYLVDYEAVSNAQMEDTLDALVQDVPRGERVDPGRIDLKRFPGLQTWWLYRMTNTARPLEEKMTLFWHGHFATAISKVTRADFMLNQNQLFRRLALGNFREMLVEVSRDPAMIIWLDNNTNIAGAPNENYARELMELFSMGINHIKAGNPNYTETDIQEIARAFTGWTIRRQGFFFNQRQHDAGSKTVFGQTGNFNGEDIVDLIVARDATAYFMTNKLWEFFAYRNPEIAVLDELVEVYFDSDYDIKTVVRHMFNMDQFYSDKAIFSQIKSPTELMVGALRMMAFGFNDARPYHLISSNMRNMDQDLFNPPTVKGWDGDLDWINTSTLLVRYNAANLLTSFQGRGFGGFEPLTFIEGQPQDAEAIVDFFLDTLGPLEISDDARLMLVSYLTDGDLSNFNLDPHTLDNKIRGLAHLVMSLPEYQLN